jgi:membrane-bound metal-dependent hydrolase YbcI (DUF457 family)
MTWKSHTLVTGAAVLAVTLDPKFAATAVVGSVLPDKIEFILPFLKHRGNSHALAVWVGLVFLTSLFVPLHPAAYYACGVAIGGLCHVLEDMCSVSGIPLFPIAWGQRAETLKVPIYKTGQLSELFTTITIVALCLGIVWVRDPDQAQSWIKKTQHSTFR